MLSIKTVTVLGANGTMGCNVAAIFASFGKANVYMISRSKEKSEEAVARACQSVKADSIKERLIPSDYSDLEECIKNSDLIFEACAESWEIKQEIHKKIAHVISGKNGKVICTGTSGLSVTELAKLYDETLRSNVFGMHFFNPPYNMTLCELISSVYSDKTLLLELYDFLSVCLKRTTINVKDKPAFLANRIGFQFINRAMQLAEEYKYNGGIDYIDAVFGAFTGRAMPPLATANFVGLDVHKAIVDNLWKNTNDYAKNDFMLPNYCKELIEQGHLGKKAGAGLYQTVLLENGKKEHFVYDIEHGSYRKVIQYTFPFAETMVQCLKTGDYKGAIAELVNNHSIEAELCCKVLLEYILYSLYVANEVADSIFSADDAMAAGFNWCPPMALVDAFSGKESFIQLCRERLEAKWLEEIHFKDLTEQIRVSNYDYRKYLRAKK